MATWIKFCTIIAVWAIFFISAYSLFTSRSNEQVMTLQKAMNQVNSWQSYQMVQTLRLNNEEEVHIKSTSHQDPYLAHVKSRARLTDTEDFLFEIYFQPDVIYVHTVNSNAWNKADYTHPMTGELEGMKDPMVFWLRMLKHSDKIKKLEIPNDGYHFIVKLRPFRDEVHGFQFNDMLSAQLEAWVSKEPVKIERMKLVIDYKPSILRRYDQVTYSVTFSSINHAPTILLPEQAYQATTLK
ncbi:hypothetical protein D0469_08015 [Peribacillus saganii]|uniref:Uncharacterized protein n=1 Tax=Peribacillus saganii TaxID=2303992 RepID=A0A372LQ83_9BACI|nr:DUF6612 family protein [Peribacillus saganii]RFU70117.1 hypothetical protein D0469_08015 [Peribacillus saganii]